MSIPLARGNVGRVVLDTLAAARRPLLFLDLDGTLAPLVDRPRRARVPAATARAIQRLRRSGVRVVLVSGRSVASALGVAHTPVDAILGDHGARLYEHGRLTTWLPASRAQFTHAADRLERLLEGTRGVRFVRKERSLAIHLRLPKNEHGRTARRIARMLRKEGLRVLFGHRILDAQLPGVDKGRAVMKWLRRHPRPDAVLYAGDDTTDEDAILALAGQAFTVAVGPRPRVATYRTSSTRTFAAWLSRLADARARRR
ncbi:MAG TPA: trehalose-phosphatase [Gemmatimonadales bacterium]|nr:trehalose-phosphatase [Gemmatimonadales bacterium]